MIKFLVLIIVEAIFFLTIGLLYYYAPESSYFWDDGFGGIMFDIYESMAESFILLTPILIFFNMLIAWLGLIKKINSWVMGIIYIELVAIIAMIPSVFIDREISFFLSITLVSAVLALILQILLRRIISFKIRISFLILFTIASIIFISATVVPFLFSFPFLSPVLALLAFLFQEMMHMFGLGW